MKTVSVEKKLLDKLVERRPPEECNENVEEVKLAKITSAEHKNKNKWSPCNLYIVLFSTTFTVNVGIGAYFVCFHWFKKNKAIVDLRETKIY